MRFISLRRIGMILVLAGILTGFLGFGSDVFGLWNFPFAGELSSSWLGLGQTITWWNQKLWPCAIGAIGLLLVKYG